MTTFTRHLGALLRKNALLKVRTLRSTLLEVLVPVAVAALLAGVKSAIPPFAQPTQAYVEYGRDINHVASLREAPPILSAQGKKLAVVGPPALVDPFVAFLSAGYPPIDGTTFGGGFHNPTLRGVRIPGMGDVITTAFSTEEELEAWVRRPDYPGSDPFPLNPRAKGRVWAAVVLKSGSPAWEYTLRLNASEVPSTRPPYVDTLDRLGVKFNLWKYAWANPTQTADTPFGGSTAGDGSTLETRAVPGFLALQQAVDRYIINLPLRVNDWSWNEYSWRLGSAFWSVVGQDSQHLWDDVWDWQQKGHTNKTAMMEDMVAFSAGDLYAPHEVLVAPFPTPAFVDQPFYAASQYSTPLVFTLAFLVPISALLLGIVSEKESRLKESMRMMGLSDVSLLLSWLITAEVQLLVTAAVIAGVLTGPGGGAAMFGLAGFGPVFLLFALFGTASVTYAAFVSVFFSTSRTASTVGSVAFIAAFFPFYATGTTDSTVSRGGKVGACVLPPTCFAMSLSHLMALEGAGSTLVLTGPDANGSVPLRNFAFTDGVGMLCASVVGFALLTWYADAVLPYPIRQYGTPKHWLFPLDPLLAACARLRAAGRAAPTSPADATACFPTVHNPVHRGAPTEGLPARKPAEGAVEPADAYLLSREAGGACVQLRGMVKSFAGPDGAVHRAVDGLDLTLYEGHITVLLGHNGAGKTTLINLVTGLIPASSGDMTVFGKDVGANFAAIREDLGVCPQHDVLWPQLTCMEHLGLFSSIKGISSSPDALRAALEDVGLQGKADAQSSTLSGGQKRKLSLAIALLGGSRFLLLDEPTSGMDPFSRRSTWDMLRKVRQGRVIVLTTHFMDEADVLGDRIAIMDKGRLHSAGTPMFLKEAFGVGYNLSIFMPPTVVSQAAVDEAQGVLTALVTRHVAEGSLSSASGRELHFSLPLASSALFPALLGELDEMKGEGTAPGGAYIIESYTLGVTTMEDVFLAVAGHGAATHAQPVVKEDAAHTIEGDTALAMVGSSKSPSAHPLHSTAYGALELPPAAPHHDAAVADPSRITPVESSSAVPRPPPPTPNSAQGGARTGARGHGSGYCRQLHALLVKRLTFARRDVRGGCLQLLLPVVTVVVGLALLQLGRWLAGDQPDLLLSPNGQFNTDPANPTGASLYPNRIPAFTFKGTDVGLEYSDELDALLRAMDVGDPLLYEDDGGRLRVRHETLNAIPDTYGLDYAPPNGPGQTEWPGKAFSAMSKLLIARQETVLRKGRAYADVVSAGGTPRLEDALVGGRDGGSVYGALVFLLNGTNGGGTEDGTESWFTSYRRTALLGRGRAGDVQGQGVPTPALSYGLLVNVTAIHAPPTLMSQMHNALYRLRLALDGATGSAVGSLPDAVTAAQAGRASIRVHSHPLPYTKREQTGTSALFTFGAAAIVTVAFAFVPAAHAAFVARERECGAKQQQQLSGLSALAYWTSNYAFDYAFYTLPALACIGAAWGFDIVEFMGSDGGRAPVFVGLILLYGAAVAPFAYLLSFAFKTSMSAQTSVLMLSIFSVLLIIASLVLSQLPVTCMEERSLRFVLLLSPGYALGNGLVRLAFLSSLPLMDAVCTVSHDASADYAALTRRTFRADSTDVAGWNLIFLAAQAVVYGALTLMVDAHTSGSLLSLFRTRPGAAVGGVARPLPEDDDEDVRVERGRVEGLVAGGVDATSPSSSSSPPILMHRLRKVYQGAPKQDIATGKTEEGGAAAQTWRWLPSACCRPRVSRVSVAAVQDLSFSVPPGEVFGFLGVNGAGKTTTMQMLTGAEVPSAGQAWLQGYDVVHERTALRRLLGYCPQHDPLLDLLTVREQLQLYARLRGVPEADVPSTVAHLISAMDLSPFTSKLSGSLSGGNKRKLSVAMALIGTPPILFLDEPSTGMDPVAKRTVWRAVRKATAPAASSSSPTGACVMLTTHSMEEAEALSTRIGIMVGGRLRCVGTAQHLKGTLGQGFQLQLQLAAPSEERVQDACAAVRAALALPVDALSLTPGQVREAVTALLGAAKAGEAVDAMAREGRGGQAAVVTAAVAAPPPAAAGPSSPSGTPTSTSASVAPLPSSSSSRKLVGSVQAIAAGAANTTTLAGLATWLALERHVLAAVSVLTLGVAVPWLPPVASEEAEARGTASIFKGGHVLERHGLTVRIHVPHAQPVHGVQGGAGAVLLTPLSALFRGVEAWKAVLGVSSYGLSEATLEQVFNTFAGAGGRGGREKEGAGKGGAEVSVGGAHTPSPALVVRVPLGRGSRH